ncbi:GMC family oxidoreductase [Pseudogemmobacter humi]|uniref:Gluconate 2-dehydrogenase flavoprotein n=1 Tax=Pseudogemmobacter humi TaxID=2483812 RepID=A0A3P5WTY8_9RHOB|nr:GMC family oxidoreductase [Pseudogemmobacter humi]VDC25145.1 Gluconate 2-dehydrogenase flavoprotein precursor [Pseudogemmobacter humi]
MARQDPKKDVVIVGLGWTGAILGMELAEEGLEILALERGPGRETVPELRYPEMIDELSYGERHKLMLSPRQSTVTIRRNLQETARPMRKWGSFLLGNGVGGSGVHWNGQTWRPQPVEMQLRSHIRENWGEEIIPEDMTIGDYPVTYDELEPCFDRFERVAGISGIAGNINGEIREGGNPFEGRRSRDYPMPPLPLTWNGVKFSEAARAMGYHPFPRPGGNASTSYVNEYGMQMGACNFCGFCERYGCYQYSKSSPQTTILAALFRKPNFSHRSGAEVLRVEMAPDRRSATGVTWFDEEAGEEVFQPADIVILAAYQIENTRLMLLSGIGEPYDPVSGTGTTGKNYAYQITGSTSLFFRDEHFNPFVGSGVNGACIDDFGMNAIDFGAEGFIGGAYISSAQTNGQPIRSMPLPDDTPQWGAGWKSAIAEWYGHEMSISHHGSVMSYRGHYCDLDPTYRDRHGRPLMRITFNWHPNELRLNDFLRGKIETLAAAMQPDLVSHSYKEEGAQYDVRPYQTTHNTGGTIMAATPEGGPLNRYLQAWDKHNVFAMGAGAFVQNTQYNPTGLVGGLAYWAADAIRRQYLPNPGPLV